MAKDWCPYCGKEFTADDWRDNNRFTHGGIAFHGTCRAESIQTALKKCQAEVKQSLDKAVK